MLCLIAMVSSVAGELAQRTGWRAPTSSADCIFYNGTGWCAQLSALKRTCRDRGNSHRSVEVAIAVKRLPLLIVLRLLQPVFLFPLLYYDVWSLS